MKYISRIILHKIFGFIKSSRLDKGFCMVSSKIEFNNNNFNDEGLRKKTYNQLLSELMEEGILN